MRKALMISMLLTAACGSAGNSGNAAEPAPIGISTDANGAETIVTGAENPAGIEMPKNLPSWAAAYPGGKAVSAMAEGANGGSVSYVSGDPLSKIAAFYDGRLAAAGKEEGPKADTADSAVRFVGKDARDGGGMVMMAREKNVSTVTILYKR